MENWKLIVMAGRVWRYHLSVPGGTHCHVWHTARGNRVQWAVSGSPYSWDRAEHLGVIVSGSVQIDGDCETHKREAVVQAAKELVEFVVENASGWGVEL